MTDDGACVNIPAMLKLLQRVLTGQSRPAGRSVPARMEPLEKRSLLSAVTLEAPPRSAAESGMDVMPPTLVKEQLTGTDPRAVEGVVLTFSEPLDRASAEDLRNYRVGRRTDRQQRSVNDNRFRDNRRGIIQFESAVYDEANLTVTLTAFRPFNITRRFRAIRVLGREARGIRDVAGNVLDGNENGQAGGDAVEKYTFRRAGRVRYGELDGDSVLLTLRGPGRVWVVRQTRGGRVFNRGDAVKVFIDGADPARSVLTGSVTGRGDGIAVIDELAPVSTAQIAIASDPAFQINSMIP